MATLGEKIKAARIEQHFSLSQLARAAGLTKGFLSQVESGRSNPSLASLVKIAKALGVSSTVLLAEGDTQANDSTVPFPSVPTIVGARRSATTDPPIQVVHASDEGTHLVVELTPGVELVAPAGGTGSILCTVLEGTIIVGQAGVSLQIGAGNVAAWSGTQAYSVRNALNASCRLVLFIPRGIELPMLQKFLIPELARNTNIRRAQQAAVSALPSMASAEGPLRLVAMRAERMAERKGSQ